MKLNLIGPFTVNAPFGTEIAFSKGLKRIGIEVNEFDPNLDYELDGLVRDADATIVFKNCCGKEDYLEMLDGPVVVYQPDDARFAHIREMMAMMRPHADFLLSFDEHGATVAKSMGYKAAETLLLTADDELYCPSPEPIERDIDVSFIGSLGDPVAHASRRHMLQRVQRAADTHGWKTHFEVSQDIPHVRDIYRRSRVVLNHATDVGQEFGTGFGLQCRHFEVGMTGACLYSNRLINPVPGTPPFRQFTSDSDLITNLFWLLNPRDDKEDAGTAGRHLYEDIMKRHKPEHRAAQLVDFLQRVL